MAGIEQLSRLPMVRLQLITPFLSGLGVKRDEVETIFDVHRLHPSMVDRPDVFVPAHVMYELVESLAAASGDPFAGVHVGARLDLSNWGPLSDALGAASTFGDFLLHFIIAVNVDATSVVYTLETRAARTTFTERRVAEFGIVPRHNDGFGIAYICKILRIVLGQDWLGSEVIVHVCDPSVVPPGYLDMRVASASTLGFSVSFPTAWMLRKLRLSADHFPISITRSGPPGTVKDVFEQALSPYIGDAELSAASAARLLGASERTLARRLAKEGTTIGREIARIRLQLACETLAQSREPIATVAEIVGYRDPAIFARAFKRWTGMSPSVFRHSHGGQQHV